MSFSNKAKELREMAGLSQMRLSEKIGISAAAIGFLENHDNEPKGSTVAAYAKFFEVSADYLLGLEDDFGTRTPAPMSFTAPTSEEKKLLEIYHSLSPEMRNTLWSLLSTWTPEPTNTHFIFFIFMIHYHTTPWGKAYVAHCLYKR